MLKRWIQVSSLTAMLALTALLPAAASVNEEDAAAPAGSFTSDMAIPARVGETHAAFFARHHARMMEWRARHHFG
jgi:hypothetical protein